MDAIEAERCELVKLTKFYYLCNIIRIYLSIKFYLANQLVYFVFFWIHFILDKIIGIFIAKINVKTELYQLALADTCQVGFVYFSKGKFYNLERIYVRYLVAGLLPSIFLDLIFLFGDGMLHNKEMMAVDLFLAYINVLGQLLLTAFIVLQMEFIGQEYLLKHIQIMITGYLTTAALMEVSLSLLLWNLGVIVVSMLVTFALIKSKNDYRVDLLRQLICVFCMIPLTRILYSSLIQKKYITIILYFYTGLRLVLVIIYTSQHFINSLIVYNQIHSGEQIVLANQIIAFITSLLSLYFDSTDFRIAITKYRIFFIHSRDSLQQANADLNNKCDQYTHIEIYLVSKSQIISTLGYNQLQNDEICKCSSNLCKLHYQLIKNIINLIKKSILIQVFSFSDYPMCFEQKLLLLQEEEILPDYYFNTFRIERFQDKILFKCLFERYFKGYQSGKVSQNIYQLLKRANQKKIKEVQAVFFQVSGFLKHIKNEINFLPYQLILYDLYEF